jgi:alpha-beta hydrolase superfamily lysophospholipase
VRDNAHQITLPVLFTHGGADRLNAASGIAPYAERLSSPDKTVQIYPEAFHEPHNEVDHATVVADVVAWIEDRLLARP